MEFPKMTNGNAKGITGEAYFQYFVNEYLKCIYHQIHKENDFGLDGYIEIVKDGNVTGKHVGVQIKHGNSYFNNTTNYGYKYIGKEKHLNYYANDQIPIYIIIMDDELEKINWVKFDIEKTMQINDNNWCIEIPKENEIRTNFKQSIFNEIDEIIDYDEQIQYNWIMNSGFMESDKKFLAIPKNEIIENRFQTINNYIKKMSINKETLINSKTTVDIFFPEYSTDLREIIDIPEVMNWLKNSIYIGIPWFYFLNYKNQPNNCFNFLVHSYCRVNNRVKIGTKYICEYNIFDLNDFFEKNFDNMKKFIEKNHIEEKINEEIKTGILNLMKEI